VLALLADAVEEEQLCDADTARREGQEVLGNSAADVDTLRQALEASNRALANALRVADSRGDRLADYEADEDETGDGGGNPRLPGKPSAEGTSGAVPRVSFWVSFTGVQRRSPRYMPSAPHAL